MGTIRHDWDGGGEDGGHPGGEVRGEVVFAAVKVHVRDELALARQEGGVHPLAGLESLHLASRIYMPLCVFIDAAYQALWLQSRVRTTTRLLPVLKVQALLNCSNIHILSIAVNYVN